MRTRMHQFFLDNPDAELTYDIAREKFGCTRSSVEHAVLALREDRIIETVHVIRISARAKGIAKD
ncbi:MAG: hypothetical protein ABUU24_10095 [Variovorax sp.]